MRSIKKRISSFIALSYCGSKQACRLVPAYILVISALICAGLISLHTWSTMRLSEQAVTAAESTANRRIAELFAERLGPRTEKASLTTLESRLDNLAALNPAIRLYIVDSRGIVRASPLRYGPVLLPFVNKRPMHEAVFREEGTPAVFGDDPHYITTLNPISVAPLRLRSGPGFVYVVLAPRLDRAPLYTIFGMKLGILSMAVIVFGAILIIGLCGGAVYAHYHSINSHLAAISHDLRSPLGAIQGYLETILEKEERLSPEDRRRFMSVALKSTHSATSLIDDVHQLSKLEATNGDIQREPVAVADLVMDVVMALQPKCAAKRLSLEAEVQPVLPLCLGNIHLLERLLCNIIENSIRYTPAGGLIRVSVTHISRAVSITVLDSGVGIPRTELDRVSDPFFRGNATSKSVQGSGLGLSIASKIARLHGGELKVLSKESEGTAVVFTIPVLQAGKAKMGKTA